MTASAWPWRHINRVSWTRRLNLVAISCRARHPAAGNRVVALFTASTFTSLARSTKLTLVEIRHSRGVTRLRRRKVPGFTEALAQMKNSQNQVRIPRFFDGALNVTRKIAAEICRHNLKFWMVLSGDNRDRTGNLLVAKQELSLYASHCG